ncbi:Trans-1,2-dihydrobenzene-1,2-diol dehydrogenase-like protein [Aphelenchoides bicaudatus]|nr:Trans-1,2-dihydrobenzene-1,2-diol dehydrogenase-like protein [Aphelenchoides bicaudatus]
MRTCVRLRPGNQTRFTSFASSLPTTAFRTKSDHLKTQRAEKFAKELELDAKAYQGYDNLLADECVDVVYIGALNCAHLEWILKSLDADKHVLCEKPFVLNTQEMKQVMDKAAEKKKFIMEAFWSRFFPVWRKIRETIESNELGKLQVFGANFGEKLVDNRFHLHKGESPGIDIGYYVVGLAMYAFDDQKPKSAKIVAEKNEDGVEPWGNITLKFDEDRHAVLYYNGTMRASTAGFLAFDNGLIELPYFFWCPERFIKTTGALPDAKQEEFNSPLKDKDGYNLNNCAGLHYEADHVFEQINEGRTESPIMPLKNTMQILEVIDNLRDQIGVKYDQEK